MADDPDRGDLGAAKDDAELAGQLFSGANKASAPPSSPSEMRDHTTITNDENDAAADKLRGCLPDTMAGAAGLIATILLVLGGIAFLTSEDEKPSSSANCPSGQGLVGDAGVQLISYQQSCPDEGDQAAADGVDDEQADADQAADDEADDDEGATAGGGAPSDAFAKPTEDDLPDGAVLFSGTSAGPIGCIPCDGQSRFMSVVADGAVVGDAAAPSVATTWEQDGQITSFGARLSVPNPGGRYGIAFFYADTFEYGPGVSIETDETSAEYQWTPERDGTVEAGRPVVIIVGEGGNFVADGAYELEWWFVFEPD